MKLVKLCPECGEVASLWSTVGREYQCDNCCWRGKLPDYTMPNRDERDIAGIGLQMDPNMPLCYHYWVCAKANPTNYKKRYLCGCRSCGAAAFLRGTEIHEIKEVDERDHD